MCMIVAQGRICSEYEYADFHIHRRSEIICYEYQQVVLIASFSSHSLYIPACAVASGPFGKCYCNSMHFCCIEEATCEQTESPTNKYEKAAQSYQAQISNDFSSFTAPHELQAAINPVDLHLPSRRNSRAMSLVRFSPLADRAFSSNLRRRYPQIKMAALIASTEVDFVMMDCTTRQICSLVAFWIDSCSGGAPSSLRKAPPNSRPHPARLANHVELMRASYYFLIHDRG